MDDDPTSPAAEASLASSEARLANLSGLARGFGRAMSGAFTGAALDGRRFEDALVGVGRKLVDLSARAAFKPLEGLVSSGLSSLLSGLGGGAAGAPSVTPFADGGVIASPAYFPLGQGLGLAGEAGAEAILPLARGPGGELGVRAAGGGGAPVVNVTIQTPDAESFRRSQASVAATLARAVARGARGS